MESQVVVDGRFSLDPTALLGKGAFCRVHAATDLHTGRRVALKVMVSGHIGQLRNEADLLGNKVRGKCNH